MLVIRLLRTGKKNQPAFRIVVTDKRKAPTHGRVVEEVGFYNPLKKEKVLKAERIKYWLSVGAKPSDTAYNFFVSEKIIEGKKIDVHKKSKKEEAPAEKTEEGAPPGAEEEKPKEEAVEARQPAEEKKPEAEQKPKEEKAKGKKPEEENKSKVEEKPKPVEAPKEQSEEEKTEEKKPEEKA